MTLPDDEVPTLTLAEAADAVAYVGDWPEDASCVAKRDGDGAKVRRTQAIMAVLGLSTGMALLIAAYFLAGGRSEGADVAGWRVAASFASMLLGFGAFMLPLLLQKWQVRRRLAGVAGAGEGRPLLVEVEDLATANKLKPSAEDVAVVVAEPGSGVVRLEGLSYAIAIREDDLLELEAMPHPSHLPRVRVVFALGGNVGDVGLALTSNAVGRGIARGLTFGVMFRDDPLLRRMREAFAIDERSGP